MSHMLEIVDGQAQIAWAGETPWRGLGVKVPDGITPDQVMKAAGADWSAEKIPSFIEIDGERIPTGRSALVRESR